MSHSHTLRKINPYYRESKKIQRWVNSFPDIVCVELRSGQNEQVLQLVAVWGEPDKKDFADFLSVVVRR